MIYDAPRFLPGGDRYLLIEFGNEMNLELNFIAQGLATAISEQNIKGVIETAPCFASMLVHYEPDDITFADLMTEMSRLIEFAGSSDSLELNSRLFIGHLQFLRRRSLFIRVTNSRSGRITHSLRVSPENRSAGLNLMERSRGNRKSS